VSLLSILASLGIKYDQKENIKPYVSTLVGAAVGIDQNSPESIEQQEWMKSLILDKIRQTGMLKGDISYSDYDSSNTTNEPATVLLALNELWGKYSLPIPVTKHGFNSPETAYQNTLGSGTFIIDPAGGTVKWSPESTKYNFNVPSKNATLKAIGDLVNAGGLFGILNSINSSGSSTAPLRKASFTPRPPIEPQHYIPNIEISREELSKAFSGGMLGGQQKFRRK